jgi:hypothetical protein
LTNHYLMSALPPKADIGQHGGNVRFSCVAAKSCSSLDQQPAGLVKGH